MQEITTLTDRGTLTLPADVRKALGLKGGQQMLVETRDDGSIVLRPAMLVPVEIYTEARIQEFAREDTALGALLDRLPGQPPRT